MDRQTFIRQVRVLFRGRVLCVFSQWVVLALIARFGGSEESGKYVLALATTAPIFMLLDLNLRVIRSTDHQHNEQFVTYVALRFICLVIACLLSVALACFLFSEKLAVFIAVIIFRVGDSVSNLAFGGYQRMQVSDRIGQSQTWKGLISLLAIGFVVPLTHGNAIPAAIVMACISAAWGLFVDLPRSWGVNEPGLSLSLGIFWESLTDWSSLSRVVRRSLPLGVDAFATSLALNVPRYSIEYYFGTSALGVFGVLSQLAFSVQLLIGSVGHAGVSVLASHRQANNRKQFWHLLNRMLVSTGVAAVLAVIGGTLVLPPLLGFVLGPEYNNMPLILILLIASCVTGTFRIAGRATQACGRYMAYTSFDIVAFVVATGFAIILVPLTESGLQGAAWSLVASALAGCTVCLWHTRYRLWPCEKEQLAAQSVAK